MMYQIKKMAYRVAIYGVVFSAVGMSSAYAQNYDWMATVFQRALDALTGLPGRAFAGCVLCLAAGAVATERIRPGQFVMCLIFLGVMFGVPTIIQGF